MMAALRAALHHQFALSASIPERLGFNILGGKRLVVCHQFRQHHGAAARHRAGGCQAGFNILDLPRTGLAAQLLNRLDDVIEPVDIALRQQATVGIERQLTVPRDAPTLNEGTTLTFLAEAEALKLHEDAVSEAIVDLSDIDVGRPHAGAAPEIVGDVFGVIVRLVGPANGVEQIFALVRPAAVGAARDINRLPLEIARAAPQMSPAQHRRHRFRGKYRACGTDRRSSVSFGSRSS